MTRTIRCRRCPSRILLLAAVFLVPLLLPATSSARDGARWPGSTITYFDGTRDKLAVRRAIEAWHRTGVKVRFRRVFVPSRANVVLRNSRNVPFGCGTGVATLGYVGPGRQGFLNILHGTAADGQACALPGQTLVVAHELGHVLGLGHDDAGCALMNSSHVNGVAMSRCLPGSSRFDRIAQWRCRIIEPRDVRRAIRKYGGTPRAVRANPWCDLVGRIGPPMPVTAAIDDVDDVASVTLTRPVDPVVPAFLKSQATDPTFQVFVDAGACRTTFPDSASVFPELSSTWSVAAGQVQATSTQRPDAGVHCWSAWAIDAFGRPSRQPATAIVDVPAAPQQGFMRHAARHRWTVPDHAVSEPPTFDLRGDVAGG